MASKKLKKKLSELKRKMRDAAEALNPAHYMSLEQQYNKLRAKNIK